MEEVAWGSMLLGIAGIFFALRLIRSAGQRLTAFERYEFENRAAGGIVQFDSWEKSQSHESSKNRARGSVVIGLLIILVGVLFFFGGFVASLS